MCKSIPSTPTSSIYLLNAAALSKLGAVQHLAEDLHSYGASVSAITETHFKTKHTDSTIGIEGFTVYQRDRPGQRGGGVALYVTSSVQSSPWVPALAIASSALEIDWVCVGDHTFIAALYIIRRVRPIKRKFCWSTSRRG